MGGCRPPPTADRRRSASTGSGVGGDDGAISLEEIEDAVVDGDSPVPARSRHRTGGPVAPHLPHRLPGCLRLEHRHLDAERRPGRLRLRPHALGDVRRRHHLRPAGADPGPAHGRRPPGRQDRPQALPHHPVGRAAGVLHRGGAGGRLPPPLARPARDHGARRGLRQRHVRAGLLGRAARAGGQGGPAGRHLAELGPDERLPGHRTGHRRPAVLAGRAGLDLRRERGHLPLRDRRAHDGDAALACGRPRRTPAAGAS